MLRAKRAWSVELGGPRLGALADGHGPGEKPRPDGVVNAGVAAVARLGFAGVDSPKCH